MIVIDTHVWIWWIAGDDRLKPTWKTLLETADQVGVSAVSCFEMAWLVRHQRVEISISLRDWFHAALEGSEIQVLPLTPIVAETAAYLPEHHRDPQDRIIIATALSSGAQLLSADTRFKEYTELRDLLIS